ncbi:S-adenosylmethionine decarboxylase [Anaerophaga thermohalophila]|uniref:S-adenosylmethionine decarboxylase family protein n=1 Tax=Anaerophaga thermohalophila TaxID=177400 RepID=UPI000492804C
MTSKIWNHSEWISETNPKRLKQSFDKILQETGHTVLDFTEHHFKPEGYTALWLLAESHFAIHTFPEDGKTYFEMSSCNRAFFSRFIELTENMN